MTKFRNFCNLQPSLFVIMDKTMFYGASPFEFRMAVRLRYNLTPAEHMLWQELRGKRIFGLRFRVQHPIYRYIADFYCHKVKLVAEIDGDSHNRKQQILTDQIRTQDFFTLGLTEMRFLNKDVESNIDRVVEQIRAKVESLLLKNPLSDQSGISTPKRKNSI